MHDVELKLLAAALIGEGVPQALKGWDGAIEIAECVDDGGEVYRVEDHPEDAKGKETFWSVYAHQTEGGVDCVADLHTEAGALAFAAGLLIARQHYAAPPVAAERGCLRDGPCRCDFDKRKCGYWDSRPVES